MGYSLTALAMLAVVLVVAFAFVNASPRAIANFLRTAGPLLACGLGLALTVFGRAGIGLPLLFFGGMWLMRNRNVSRLQTPPNPNQTSTVRSAWLEMQLDHETGDLDGLILTGPLEGYVLSQLDDGQVLSLYQDVAGDADSAALLEAYLDRRIPGWREDVEPSDTSGHRQSSGSGAMTKEEAYQVLGLAVGAGPEEIRSAHRRLMKAVHPDSGGSTFLAARINEAKQTLLK